MAVNSPSGNTQLTSGFFPPCKAGTTGSNIALLGLQVIDGVVLIAGDRVLVKDQADPTTNGLYTASTGNWIRTSDAATSSQFFDGMAVNVAQGAVNAGQTYLCSCTDDPVVIGSSLLTFEAQMSVATASQVATSSTSLTIGIGAKTFAIQSGKNFSIGQWVLAQETSNPLNQMYGQITSYVGASLTVSVTTIGGSGTVADWTIVLSNSQAAAGYQPPIGTGNTTGAGSSGAGHLTTFADTTGKILADGGKAGALANLDAVASLSLLQSAAAFGLNMLNGTISASVSGSALTLAIKTLAGADPAASDPVWFVFRSATPASGGLSVIAVTAPLSVTVPAASTLGFINATPGRIWITGVNNGGVVSLAVINCLLGTNIFPLAGWGIASVTPFGGGANTAQVFFGTGTFANVPYSVLGYCSYEAGSTLATAGTYLTAPTRVELYRPGVPLPGQVVQQLTTTNGANSTNAVNYTASNTPPAAATGVSAAARAITPTSSANLIRVTGQAMLFSQAGGAVFAYLDDGASTVEVSGGPQGTLAIFYQVLAAVLTTLTYTLYYVGNSSANVAFLNSTTTGAQFGGKANSFLRAEEIMA